MHSNRICSYKSSFGSQVTGECSVSESRVREIRLHGLDGGLLRYHFSGMEGGLP